MSKLKVSMKELGQMDRKVAARIFLRACDGEVEIVDWPQPETPANDSAEPELTVCWPSRNPPPDDFRG